MSLSAQVALTEAASEDEGSYPAISFRERTWVTGLMALVDIIAIEAVLLLGYLAKVALIPLAADRACAEHSRRLDRGRSAAAPRLLSGRPLLLRSGTHNSGCVAGECRPAARYEYPRNAAHETP